MKNTSQLFDKLAMSWAFVCAVHCAFLPIALALFPSLIAISMDDHTFHNLMLWLVIPSSGIAVLLGCRQHKDKRVLAMATVGLGLLITVSLLGHKQLGENGERIITLCAAGILTMAHWRNFKLCNRAKCSHDNC